MLYANKQLLQDILQFAQATLEKPDAFHPKNSHIKAHTCAKRIIAKLKPIQSALTSLATFSDQEPLIPITECTLDYVDSIVEIYS